jgi:hypothetical protein
MKKVTALTMLVVACFLTPKVFAQDAAAPKSDQQEQVKTIFSFKNEIGLTDDQVLKLKALLYDEQSMVDASNNKLKALGADLGKAIDDKADMSVIRSKFEDISKIQIDLSCLNVEDGRKIETILSSDQLSKWKDIQKKFSAQAKS